MTRKGLKICCGVTTLLIILLLIASIILYLTILKPKQPKITTELVTLEHVKGNIIVLDDVNVTLGITVLVDNPNYGGFKYRNSTINVTYHGEVVAEGLVGADSIPARGERNVSTSVLIMVSRLVESPFFGNDSSAKRFNFTSITSLQGKVILWKVFKVKATSYCICDISISVFPQNITSSCVSKVKF